MLKIEHKILIINKFCAFQQTLNSLLKKQFLVGTTFKNGTLNF